MESMKLLIMKLCNYIQKNSFSIIYIMPYKIFYQVCKYPHESFRNKYLVRKFIFDEEVKKFIRNETYVYGERNLNKLYKEITK